MSAKIYVGNLSWNTTDDTLRDVSDFTDAEAASYTFFPLVYLTLLNLQAFSQYGQVLDSIVMRDRETGRSRGFGFVTYANQQEAEGAIASLHDQELDGRRIKVNLANARASGGGGGGGGGGGYGGGGGGYQGGGGYNGGGGYGGGYQQQGGGGYGSGGYGGGGYGGGGGY